jgi:response regulator RpfG family c-di-GMP phosphodiesterase
MCVRTAQAINETKAGPFKEVSYSDADLKEIEFAGLLHDFGKVYIDPAIFIKAKKLYPRDLEYLNMRLYFLYRSLELESLRKGAPPAESEKKLAAVKEIMHQVAILNEPRIENTDPEAILLEILSRQVELNTEDLEGSPIPILEPEEVKNLGIPRGSLNRDERSIIETHVEHTYNFVSKIPWPDEYKRIPEIAFKHHEKLDGSGYPLGLSDPAQIPVASRIMVIADIYDALSAKDRPYKKPVPMERVFSILREEAAAGKLDADLVELFIECRAWENISPGKVEASPE